MGVSAVQMDLLSDRIGCSLSSCLRQTLLHILGAAGEALNVATPQSQHRPNPAFTLCIARGQTYLQLSPKHARNQSESSSAVS